MTSTILVLSLSSLILLLGRVELTAAKGIKWDDDGWLTTGRDCDFHKNGRTLTKLKTQNAEGCKHLCLGRTDCSHYVYEGDQTYICKLRTDHKVSTDHAVKGAHGTVCGIINMRTVEDLGPHVFGDIVWRAGCNLTDVHNNYRTQFPTDFLQCTDMCRNDHHCFRIMWTGGECHLFLPPQLGGKGAEALSANDEDEHSTYCAIVDYPTGYHQVTGPEETEDETSGRSWATDHFCIPNGRAHECMLNTDCCSGYCEWRFFGDGNLCH